MLRRNIFSVTVAIVILFSSLTGAESFTRLSFASFPGADKIVHFLIYLVFMSVVIFEHRSSAGKPGQLILLSLFPVLFGSLMELLQAFLTSSRSGSWLDFLANLAGIFTAILISFLIKKLRPGFFR
jgi:VanZ family protein